MEKRVRSDPEALLAHAAWMRSLARRLVGDPAAADDVVQDATVAALRDAPEDGGPLEPWLSRVVRNLAWRRRRGEARRAAREALAARDVACPSPADALERIDAERALLEALRALDEPLRTVVVLRYLEGKSSAEIARATGAPAGTVRWRLKRALDELRERLDERFGSRASWMAVFLPIARPDFVPPLAAGPGDALEPAAEVGRAVLEGAIAMSGLHIAACATAVVVVGGVAWWALDGRAAVAPAEPAALVAAPDAPIGRVGSPDPIALASGDAPAGAARVAAVPGPVAATEPTPSEAPAPAEARMGRIDARAVDSQGAAWSGTRLLALDRHGIVDELAQRATPSGADGRAELEVTFPDLESGWVKENLDEQWGLMVVVSREGCASVAVPATLREGETVHLGDVVLVSGARIRGRVVDARGAGVAGATVGIAPSELPGDAGRRLRHGADEFDRWTSVRSGADGSFALVGVAPGTPRVWAQADGTRYAWTEPLAVEPGGEVLGVEIPLVPLGDADRVGGVVLDPSGAPAPHAMLEISVSYLVNGASHKRSSFTNADAQGRFALVIENDGALYDFNASDNARRYAEATAEDVGPGTVELVLQLTERRTVLVRVRDGEGNAVEGAEFELSTRTSTRDVRSEPADDGAPGTYVVAVSDGSFELVVEAKGFREARRGPYDGRSLPSELEIVLERAPVVRGRVLVDGTPRAGVPVQLLRDDPSGLATVNGLRTRMHRAHRSTATSDADGRYAIDVDAQGAIWVRAEADGFAPAEIGPIELAELTPEAEFDFALGPGGSIEGRVILPDGRDAEGTIVAINHGDGEPRTGRAGPGGRFRFDLLAPGPWQVLPWKDEIDPGITQFASTKADGPIEWSCEVALGRTTRFDLDLTRP